MIFGWFYPEKLKANLFLDSLLNELGNIYTKTSNRKTEEFKDTDLANLGASHFRVLLVPF